MKKVSFIINTQSFEGKPSLLDSVKRVLYTNHYTDQTDESYILWIKRFIPFNNNIHPKKPVPKPFILISIISLIKNMFHNQSKIRHFIEKINYISLTELLGIQQFSDIYFLSIITMHYKSVVKHWLSASVSSNPFCQY